MAGGHLHTPPPRLPDLRLDRRLGAWWKGVLAVLGLVCLVGFFTRGVWILSLGRSLVCTEEIASSDAILVENFDPNYSLFERVAALQRAGLVARVLVPTQTWEGSSEPERVNPVSSGIVEVMARLAHVHDLEIIPIHEMEPYSLNAAYQVRDFLLKEQLRSVAIVVPALRSRRSSLIHRAVLGPAGIQTHCLPVFDQHTPANWTTTWHGIQVVAEQFIKLQFYRFYLLRGQLG